MLRARRPTRPARSSPRRMRARTSPALRLRITRSKPWAGRATSRSMISAPHTRPARLSRPRPASSRANSRSAPRNTDATRQRDHDRGVGGPGDLTGERLEQHEAGHAVEPGRVHEARDRSGQQGLERVVEQLAGPSLGLGMVAQDHAVAVDQHHGRASGQRALDHGALELAQVERARPAPHARCRPRRSPGVSEPPSAGGGPGRSRSGRGSGCRSRRRGAGRPCRYPPGAGRPPAPSRSSRRPGESGRGRGSRERP